MQNKKYKITWGLIPIVIVIILVVVSSFYLYILKVEKDIPKSSQEELLFSAGTSTKSVIFYDNNGQQAWDWVQGVITKSPESDKTFVSITLSYTRYPTESGYEISNGEVYIANIYDGACKEKRNIRHLLPKIIKDTNGKSYGAFVNEDILKLNTPLSIKLYKQQNFLSNLLIRLNLVKPVACADL
jgi:heme/copper-type cytochrome/quinol oxidase subunit 2